MVKSGKRTAICVVNCEGGDANSTLFYQQFIQARHVIYLGIVRKLLLLLLFHFCRVCKSTAV